MVRVDVPGRVEHPSADLVRGLHAGIDRIDDPTKIRRSPAAQPTQELEDASAPDLVPGLADEVVEERLAWIVRDPRRGVPQADGRGGDDRLVEGSPGGPAPAPVAFRPCGGPARISAAARWTARMIGW